LRLDETDPLKWQDLGQILLDLQRFQDATRAFRRALRLDNLLVRSHSGLAHALDMLNRHADALAEYDRALELDAEEPSIWNNRAVLLAESLGRNQEACKLRSSPATDPNYHLAHFNRASCW
jgi:Flp pilus assembly protein TadD